MSKSVLSEKELSVYKFLCRQIEGGTVPTIREICTALNIKSTSGVHKILNTLEEKEYIARPKGASRSVKILNTEPVSSVPIMGEIAAGEPIFAVESIEGYIPFPKADNDGLFALRVKGESMREVGILNGDIIIADRNIQAKVGDIIVGFDGDSATVKTLAVVDGKIVFLPQNPDFLPIYPENPVILGKVIGNFRKY